MRRVPILALLLATGILLAASDASAGDRYHGVYSGLPYYGYGHSGSLYGLGFVPVPPYYALHPPVYYSEPIARPYGDSPFARGPECSCYGHVEAARPAVTINPYYEKPAEPAKPPRDKTVGSPKFIVNPYYQPSVPAKLASAE